MKYRIELLIILLTAYYTISFAQNSGAWVTIDSLLEARVGHAIVVLPNGNILVSGGEGGYVNSRKTSSEIYDITTSKWRYTTPMNIKRFHHNLVLLKTGNVLAIGGYKERSCELFDPVTETWTMTDSIPTMRFDGQSITELKDGRILVSGGFRTSNVANSAEYLTICEIYDPVTDKWLPAATLNIGRYNHTATLLNDGKVMIAGGFSNIGSGALRSCEIYDPSNNTWLISASLNEPRSRASSILLPNGNVFISGGDSTGVGIIPWKKSCEVFDAIRGNWFYVEDMFNMRIGHQIYYMVKTNQLLIIGGAIMQQSVEDTWETYDPINLKPMQNGIFPLKKKFERNTVKLKDEKIILIGGQDFDFSEYDGLPYAWVSKSCQLFDILATSVEYSQSIPGSYTLLQNYPNPFNPTTTITYSVPKTSTIKLAIYNILGRQVAVLVDEEKNAGTYSIQFNAQELPSGVYFYRLLSGTYSVIKKMLFIK